MGEINYVKELKHPCFKSPEVIIEEIDPEAIYVSGVPFWQEQLFYKGQKSMEPWQLNAKKVGRKLAKQMENLLEAMDKEFQNGQIPPSSLLQDTLGVFISLLFWSNGKPVCLNPLHEQLNNLALKPANIHERLNYCLTRENIFVTFNQLKKLLLEQCELIAKHCK